MTKTVMLVFVAVWFSCIVMSMQGRTIQLLREQLEQSTKTTNDASSALTRQIATQDWSDYEDVHFVSGEVKAYAVMHSGSGVMEYGGDVKALHDKLGEIISLGQHVGPGKHIDAGEGVVIDGTLKPPKAYYRGKTAEWDEEKNDWGPWIVEAAAKGGD